MSKKFEYIGLWAMSSSLRGFYATNRANISVIFGQQTIDFIQLTRWLQYDITMLVWTHCSGVAGEIFYRRKWGRGKPEVEKRRGVDDV